MEEAYKKSKNLEFEPEDWASEKWEEVKEHKDRTTFVNEDRLARIGEKISTLPAEGKFHPQIVKIFKNRLQSIVEKKGIDWGTAEALAFATLIDDGYHVRLSGQDVERGTFSHRHAHVFYQDKDGAYVPINSISGGNSTARNFIASNSHLSEYAVLGFELGYA